MTLPVTEATALRDSMVHQSITDGRVESRFAGLVPPVLQSTCAVLQLHCAAAQSCNCKLWCLVRRLSRGAAALLKTLMSYTPLLLLCGACRS